VTFIVVVGCTLGDNHFINSLDFTEVKTMNRWDDFLVFALGSFVPFFIVVIAVRAK